MSEFGTRQNVLDPNPSPSNFSNAIGSGIEPSRKTGWTRNASLHPFHLKQILVYFPILV